MADAGLAGEAGARFDFGRIVSQTFAIIGHNFVLFTLMALLFVGVPQFAVLYGQNLALQSGDTGTLGLIGFGGFIVGLVTNYVLQGALTRAAVDHLSRAGVSFGAAVGDGFRYFFPLLLVAILVWIGVVAGTILLIVPGIILAVRWAVTAPVVVVERHGPTRSMGRSAELTEGHRWATFGLFLLYMLLAYGAQIVAALIYSAFGNVSMGQLTGTEPATLAYIAASAVVAALITLVSTTGTAALYFELRRVKEGVGVAELAAVFD